MFVADDSNSTMLPSVTVVPLSDTGMPLPASLSFWSVKIIRASSVPFDAQESRQMADSSSVSTTAEIDTSVPKVKLDPSFVKPLT